MPAQLADLHELALESYSEKSAKIISEAITAYEAGAFRSSVIICWISIVWDLIDKIRELALAGDPTARTVTADISQTLTQISSGSLQGVDKALKFEREILELARDRFLFVDNQEYSELSRIRDDRNLCAHPTFSKEANLYQPSAELARLHIATALRLVLTQPPVQGRSAIEQLYKTLLSEHFPRLFEHVILELDASALRRASEPLVKGLIDEIVIGFVESSRPVSLGNIANLVKYLEQKYPVTTSERLTFILNKILRRANDTELASACLLLSRLLRFWSTIEAPNKERFLSFLTSGNKTIAVRLLPPLLGRTEEDLSFAAQHFLMIADDDVLATLVKTHYVGPKIKETLLRRYGKVASWHEANEVFEKIIRPIIPNIGEKDIDYLLERARTPGVDLIGSTGFGRFLDTIWTAEVISREKLEQKLANSNIPYRPPSEEKQALILDEYIPF